MENSFKGLQELSIDSLTEINGGEVSTKTIIIGCVAGAIFPLIGIGFIVGYCVNS
jgi:hypothetical protein